MQSDVINNNFEYPPKRGRMWKKKEETWRVRKNSMNMPTNVVNIIWHFAAEPINEKNEFNEFDKLWFHITFDLLRRRWLLLSNNVCSIQLFLFCLSSLVADFRSNTCDSQIATGFHWNARNRARIFQITTTSVTSITAMPNQPNKCLQKAKGYHDNGSLPSVYTWN